MGRKLRITNDVKDVVIAMVLAQVAAGAVYCAFVFNDVPLVLRLLYGELGLILGALALSFVLEAERAS